MRSDFLGDRGAQVIHDGPQASDAAEVRAALEPHLPTRRRLVRPNLHNAKPVAELLGARDRLHVTATVLIEGYYADFATAWVAIG